MATLAETVMQATVQFLQTYVLPYLVILAISLFSVWFAFALSRRNTRARARRALAVELRTNARITKDIVEYADSQLSGDTSVSPMVRYQTQAFLEYKRNGLFRRLPPKIYEELESLYLSKESVNEAGRRQEELAFGPAAAFPNAHTLRLENLTYIRDTAHNVIEPYLDRLKATRV